MDLEKIPDINERDTDRQVKLLEDIVKNSSELDTFKGKLKSIGIERLSANSIDTVQINLGKLCNQSCKHCHVDGGPGRTEVMSKETMIHCLKILKSNNIPTVDITGGAPEMNPNFRWFVEECRKLVKHVIVRCNFTIIYYDQQYNDLPEFFANNSIEVIGSLPFYKAERANRQRGQGVFETSIKAIKRLNELGYGDENSKLVLNLIYNPTGAFLPAPQKMLEQEYKKVLKEDHGVYFNNLFAMTNMPIFRYLDYLVRTDNFIGYIEKLYSACNPTAINNLMCRNMISISWDGFIYDCDFNQMLNLKIKQNGKHAHISDFDRAVLDDREIITSQHCFGCTAGAGSSCGGNIA